jgi:hypothetical protein
MGKLLRLKTEKPDSERISVKTDDIGRQRLTYQPDYSISYGEKYQPGMDAVDITKLMRQDIKAAIKAGLLPDGKYSVRLRRYSGGQSIDMTASHLQTCKLVLNPERVQWEKEHPHLVNPHNRYTAEGDRILEELKSIHNAYNYDGSDTMSDCYNVNYYGHPDYDWQWLREQENTILEALQ